MRKRADRSIEFLLLQAELPDVRGGWQGGQAGRPGDPAGKEVKWDAKCAGGRPSSYDYGRGETARVTGPGNLGKRCGLLTETKTDNQTAGAAGGRLMPIGSPPVTKCSMEREGGSEKEEEAAAAAAEEEDAAAAAAGVPATKDDR